MIRNFYQERMGGLTIGEDTEADHITVLICLYVLILIGNNIGCHFESIQCLFNFFYQGLDINRLFYIINGSHIKGFLNVHDICNS